MSRFVNLEAYLGPYETSMMERSIKLHFDFHLQKFGWRENILQVK